MAKIIRWGILGTGFAAKTFAQTVVETKCNLILGVASRSQSNAIKFAKSYNIKYAYSDYYQLLENKDIDAIYIALPNILHEEWVVKAAKAKKHILCEKPFTINYYQAQKALKAVKEAGVFCMEAFMYRCHPQTLKIIDLISSDIIGKIHAIDTSFAWPSVDVVNANNSAELGGGSILSMGCYCTSMIQLLVSMGVNNLHPIPMQISGDAYIGSRSSDEFSLATFKFADDCYARAQVSTLYGVCGDLKITGQKGIIFVENPWLPSESNIIKINLYNGEKNSHRVDSKGSLYSHEIRLVNELINQNLSEADNRGMSWQSTLNNMQILDLWRKSIGLQYEFEKK